jgi:hypothetical protein
VNTIVDGWGGPAGHSRASIIVWDPIIRPRGSKDAGYSGNEGYQLALDNFPAMVEDAKATISAHLSRDT